METMMNRRDYDAMTGMLTLREAMGRLLADSFVPGELLGDSSLGMLLDLYETGDALTLRASLPGVKPEDIDITVTGDTLTLRAESHDTSAPKDGERARYHQREHRFGTVTRSLTLPVEVQPDKVEAAFEHGVLTLIMPKAARSQPRSIKINTHRDAAPIAAPPGDTPASAPNAPTSSDTTGAATRSGAPGTEDASSANRDTTGTVGTAATASSAGASSGGPSDADADATPSLS
jgi:HSP20 family protein